MIPAQRQRRILSTVARKKVVGIGELTELLGVSHMTVRRDIRALEDEGRVLPVPGGVRLVERIVGEPARTLKAAMHAAEKRGIARAAAPLAPPGAAVYLDAGATCLALAEALAPRRDITVITNDFAVTAYLMRHAACDLYHSGGRVIRENDSCAGEEAARAIRAVNIDVAFISASSWDTRYISTPTESKVPVKRAVAASSATLVLVSDSSKYGKVGFFNAVPISECAVIVTDAGLDPRAREVLARCGPEILIARPEP